MGADLLTIGCRCMDLRPWDGDQAVGNVLLSGNLAALTARAPEALPICGVAVGAGYAVAQPLNRAVATADLRRTPCRMQ
jgi:hypothetical protein